MLSLRNSCVENQQCHTVVASRRYYEKKRRVKLFFVEEICHDSVEDARRSCFDMWAVSPGDGKLLFRNSIYMHA
jgi:hypothetical protein